MSGISLLEALDKRVPFRTARRLLVASGYPTGQGWDTIHQKLKEPDVAAKADPTALLSFYIQSLAATEKAVQVFKLSDQQKDALREALTHQLTRDSTHSFAKAYPYPLEQASLDALSQNEIKVAGKISAPDGDIFALCYFREMRYRVQLSPTQVDDDNSSRFREVYAIQVDRTQSIDSIYIPSDSQFVYLLSDNPLGLSKDILLGSFKKVQSYIKIISGSDLLSAPTNLFKAIPRLYADVDLKVVAYDHTSNDSSMRSEKMRGARYCLRDADFHKAGMDAVNGDTDAYGIEVCWEMESEGRITAHPQLSIIGSSNLIYETQPSIKHAHIGKAATINELRKVLSVLSSKLAA